MNFFDFLKEKLHSRAFLVMDGKRSKEILGGTLISIGSLCMAIAIILLLGQLFHKIQPWFSIIQGLLTFLFGLYCFWDAHRIYKISFQSYRKAWGNYNFRFSIKAGGITLVASIFTFFIATLKNHGFPWVSVTLLIVGLVLLFLGFYCFGLFKLLVKPIEFCTEEIRLADAVHLGQIVGLSIVGLLYVTAFLPLTFWSAVIHGLDPIDVLLFAHLPIPKLSAELGIIAQLPTIFNFYCNFYFSNPSYLFAYGVFYGIFGIITALMKTFLRKEGWLEVLLMSNGLLSGYMLTIWIKHLLGAPLSSSLLFSSVLNFGYIILLYYGLRVFLDIIPLWGIRKKYEHLIGGIQSMGTAWILSRIFGDQAVIFSGVTFFVCTFIATSVFEATIGRLVKLMYKHLPEQRVESIVPAVLTMVRERNPEFRISLRMIVVCMGIVPIFAFGILKLVIRVF